MGLKAAFKKTGRVLASPVTKAVRLAGIYRHASTLVDALDDAKADPTLYRAPSHWNRLLTAARGLATLLPPLGDAHMKNIKTTLAGLGAVIAIATKILNGGGIEAEDIALLTAAVGLFFAKDHNVTGGTKAG